MVCLGCYICCNWRDQKGTSIFAFQVGRHLVGESPKDMRRKAVYSRRGGASYNTPPLRAVIIDVSLLALSYISEWRRKKDWWRQSTVSGLPRHHCHHQLRNNTNFGGVVKENNTKIAQDYCNGHKVSLSHLSFKSTNNRIYRSLVKSCWF